MFQSCDFNIFVEASVLHAIQVTAWFKSLSVQHQMLLECDIVQVSLLPVRSSHASTSEVCMIIRAEVPGQVKYFAIPMKYLTPFETTEPPKLKYNYDPGPGMQD